MKFAYLIMLLPMCFALSIITIDREGVALIETNEPFEKTFEFAILDGNFTMNGSTVIPSPYILIETRALTSKNGTMYILRIPFHSKVFLPKPISVLATPNIEEASFAFDKVSLTVSPGEIYYILKEDTSQSQALIVTIIAILFILLILFLLFFRGKEKQLLPQKPDANVLRFLTENERILYTKIFERSGITQKELMAITSLPKSTISVTLKRLVAKGLIESAKVGISVKLYPVKK